jgi:hypothetical protein
MLDEIKQLEAMNEEYEVRIDELEKIILSNNNIGDDARGTIIEKLSSIK